MEIDAVAALAAGPLGDGIARQDLAAFLMSGWAREQSYRSGEVIFTAGDVPTRLFVLVSGSVLLRQETEGGKRIYAAEIGAPGDVVGDAALFRAPLPYDFSAEVMRDAVFIEIARGLFTNAERGATASKAAVLITRNLLRLLAAKNERLTRQARVLGGENPRQRIARYLLVPPLPQAVGHEQIARYLAVSPPALSRELAEMEKDGLIKLAGRIIKIVDAAALGELL